MTSRFTPYELCLLADFLCDDIYDAIEYSCPVYYKNAASLLNNPSDPKTSYFANKWEVDKFKLASKLSSMNINDSQRLTLALIIGNHIINMTSNLILKNGQKTNCGIGRNYISKNIHVII